MARIAVLGLISDTHGLMRPEALAALAGSDLIIHAGDVGRGEILEQLRAVAPVVAVRGNIDTGEWASELPETANVEAAGVRIYVVHDWAGQEAYPTGIVVSGHSHRHGQTERSGVLYINPGSAGPRRFSLPITVARLDLRQKPWRAEFIALQPVSAHTPGSGATPRQRHPVPGS